MLEILGFWCDIDIDAFARWDVPHQFVGFFLIDTTGGFRVENHADKIDPLFDHKCGILFACDATDFDFNFTVHCIVL